MSKVTTIERSTTVIATRSVPGADAGCYGYVSFREVPTKDHVSTQDMVPLDFIEFGDEIRVDVKVTVLKHGRPSKKKCHNPWPAHGPFCQNRKKRK